MSVIARSWWRRSATDSRAWAGAVLPWILLGATTIMGAAGVALQAAEGRSHLDIPPAGEALIIAALLAWTLGAALFVRAPVCPGCLTGSSCRPPRGAVDALRSRHRARLHEPKLVVCDDWVLTGSYNCSHSGEMNAENLLEIHDAALAEQCAAFCDEVHARYA